MVERRTRDRGSPINNLRLLLGHLVHVNTTIVAVVGEWFHVQLGRSQQVPLTNLNHRTPFGDAIPRLMQQLTRERIEGHINPSTSSFAYYVSCEGGATRVEDLPIWYFKGVDQELPLLGTTHGHIDVGLEHLGHLNGSYADTASGAMDEHGLPDV